MEKVGFVFLPSYLEAIEALPRELRLELFEALCTYGVEGVELETDNGVVRAMMTLLKRNVEQSRKRYLASKENGAKGGRPRKNLSETQPEPSESKEKEKEMEKEMEMDKEEERETETETESASASEVSVCGSASSCLPLGEFENVSLSEQELRDFQERRPFDWYDWIEDLSSYMASTGRRYENHYATLLSWIKRKSPTGEVPVWDETGRTDQWSARPGAHAYSMIPN